MSDGGKQTNTDVSYTQLTTFISIKKHHHHPAKWPTESFRAEPNTLLTVVDDRTPFEE